MTPSCIDATTLAMIEGAAEAGLPCPSNPDIAERHGFSSVSSGARSIERLEGAGLIRVERGNCSRVVTILASGKRTAGVVGKPHWRMLRKPRPIAPYARTREAVGPPLSMLPVPVDRDPCPRCGTRRDLGCIHFSPISTGSALVAQLQQGA